MDSFKQDMKYSVRVLRKRPWFTLIAVLTLALGIGPNVVIFSFLSAVLFGPLPFPDSDRLVDISSTYEAESMEIRAASYPEIQDWDDLDAFEAVAGAGRTAFNLSGGERPVQVQGGLVTPNYFSILQVPPELGRTLQERDNVPPTGLPVVVLSHHVWQQYFGGDPDIVDKTLRLNEVEMQVVGVMPEEFRGGFGDNGLWVPIRQAPNLLDRRPLRIFESRNVRWLASVGRLAPGVTLEEAEDQLDALSLRLQKDFPADHEDRGAFGRLLEENLLGDTQKTLILLAGAVGLVLLIASANVVSLLLGQSASRRREIAVRAAMGADRTRLVRQLLTETGLLVLAGGGVGLLFGWWGLGLLERVSPLELPIEPEIHLDPTVFGLTFLLMVVVAILLGLIPAFRVLKTDLTQSLKGVASAHMVSRHSLRRLRPTSLLAAGEVAIAILVLIGAGLVIESFRQQSAVEPGFQMENAVVLDLLLPVKEYDPLGARQFVDELVRELESLPGVISAAAGSDMPLPVVEGYSATSIQSEDQAQIDPELQTRVYQHKVTSGFFRTLGIPMIEGQTFKPLASAEDSLEVVVSRSYAETVWPGERAVGKRLRFGPGSPWFDVVGVVGDVRYRTLLPDPQGNPDDPDVYFPFYRIPDREVSLVVRSELEPASIIQTVRREIQRLDPNLPLFNVATLEQAVGLQLSLARFSSLLFTLFGILCLILAVIGIYGVMGYAVSKRVHEMGIRKALGADPSKIRGLILWEGARITAVGLGIGGLGALALSRILHSQLFGVNPTDPAIFLGAILMVAVVAMIACYVPARRASQWDPLESFRRL